MTALSLCFAAHAQIWTEQGDADYLPETAQSTGSGVLATIQGTLQGYYDVDMYAISITDPANFSAAVSSSFDSQLWLFDANGKGVSFGEDINGVQGGLNSNCIPAPGVYYIAVSWYPNAALGCGEEAIWNSTPWNEVRCPDGPERTSRVAQWRYSGGSGEYSYTISLQGAAGATAGDPADCPPIPAWDEFNDGGVDDADLLAVLFSFGQSGGQLGRVDVNCDQVVDDADLLVVLFSFGSGC